MSKITFVNASPIIILAKAGLLNFLKLAGDRVIVPQNVVDEICNHYPDASTVAFEKNCWIEKKEVRLISPEILSWDLGVGESSVLTCGLDHPESVLILDDLAARKCARAMNLIYKGTLGLVLLAKKCGMIPSAREVIFNLQNSGLFLSDSVINKALTNVGE